VEKPLSTVSDRIKKMINAEIWVGRKHVMCQTQKRTKAKKKIIHFPFRPTKNTRQITSYFNTCQQITYPNKFLIDNWIDETLHFRQKSANSRLKVFCLNSFVHQSSLALVQANIYLTLPLLHCSCSLHDHHTTC
jgi:hypothetical protein